MYLPGKILLLCLLLFSAQTLRSETQSGNLSPLPGGYLLFKPKNLGAPKIRVGGGTRSSLLSGPSVYVFAPEQAGYTVHSQPDLYWYVSGAVDAPIDLEISANTGTLLKTRVNASGHSGLQVWKLADYQVQLQPEVQYRWQVSIAADPQQNAANLSAHAGVIYAPASTALQTSLEQAAPLSRAQLYAEDGDWYDAFATLQATAQTTSDANIMDIRKQFLEQVGLMLPE